MEHIPFYLSIIAFFAAVAVWVWAWTAGRFTGWGAAAVGVGALLMGMGLATFTWGIRHCVEARQYSVLPCEHWQTSPETAGLGLLGIVSGVLAVAGAVLWRSWVRRFAFVGASAGAPGAVFLVILSYGQLILVLTWAVFLVIILFNPRMRQQAAVEGKATSG